MPHCAGARASLDVAITQLGYGRIVAPIDGVVASVATHEGETVAASFAGSTSAASNTFSACQMPFSFMVL